MHLRTAAMRSIFRLVRWFSLKFVQRSANLLQRGIASAQPALPLPFLGVSSLNLGRLDFPDGLFFCLKYGDAEGAGRPAIWRTIRLRGLSAVMPGPERPGP